MSNYFGKSMLIFKKERWNDIKFIINIDNDLLNIVFLVFKKYRKDYRRNRTIAICYFDNKCGNKYNCQYEIKENEIEVEIDYDISQEFTKQNGIRTVGIDTKFKARDILIIDNKKNSNYLLKNACYCGHSMTFGTPDNTNTTKFYSQFYMFGDDYKKLSKIEKNCKIEKIKIYSKLINEFIGFPSLFRGEMNAKHIIELKNNPEKQNGCIKIELEECIDYEETYDYIKELSIYFQLLKPNKFYIDKIEVEIDGTYYGLGMLIDEIKYKHTYVKRVWKII